MDAIMTPASVGLLLCIGLGLCVLAVLADGLWVDVVRAMWRVVNGRGLDVVLAVYLVLAGVAVTATGTAPAGSWPRQIGWVLLACAVPAMALLAVRLGGRVAREGMTS